MYEKYNLRPGLFCEDINVKVVFLSVSLFRVVDSLSLVCVVDLFYRPYSK